VLIRLIYISLCMLCAHICLAKNHNINPYVSDLRHAFIIDPVVVCVDNNNSYPYYFINQHQEILGLHVDLVSKAIAMENIAFSFEAANFASCLQKAKIGEINAILDIAYTKERSDYIIYPDDTDKNQEKISNPVNKNVFEKHAVGTFDYVVITNADTNAGYEFNGNLRGLPTPIRVVKDYAIIEYLESFNLKLNKSERSLINFESLLSSKLGCIIDLRSVANFFNKQENMKDQFFIHSELVYRENLYLGFAKNSETPHKLMHKIWDNIEKLKNNKEYMRELFKKYNH
jgi:hypothetical protein